jgi:RHS repeat-associated protein
MYSLGGDLRSVTEEVVGSGSSSTQTYSYSDPQHRHQVMSTGDRSFIYDPAGRQVIRARQGIDGGQAIDYNEFAMPWRVWTQQPGEPVLEFEYDAGHNRVVKRTPAQTSSQPTPKTTIYAGDLYECVGDTPVAGGSFSCSEQRFKVYAGSELVLQVTRFAGSAPGQPDQRRYVHGDHLGSSTMLTTTPDANGEIQTEQRQFDPFGDTSTDFTESSVRSGYTGHEHDPELGLINMKGRLYDAKLRRFVTPDPFVTEPFNPQGLNRYSYVQNNPLTYTDPSGFDISDDPYQGSSGGGGGGPGYGVGGSTPLQITVDADGNIQIGAPTPTREGPNPTPGTQPGSGTESEGPCAVRPATPQPATNQAQGGTQTETPDAPASDMSGRTLGGSPPSAESIGSTPNGPAGSETSQASSSQSAGPVCTTASASATPQAPSQSTWNPAQSGNPGLWPWNGPPSPTNTPMSDQDRIKSIMFGLGYASSIANAIQYIPRWQGQNGGWYSLDWGGNASTAGRSLGLSRIGPAGIAGVGLYGAQVLVGAYDMGVAYRNDDYGTIVQDAIGLGLGGWALGSGVGSVVAIGYWTVSTAAFGMPVCTAGAEGGSSYQVTGAGGTGPW